VNKCNPRLTVGAAHVRTSEMKYFDSRDGELGVKHIMASGALPPAFPAVRIDGELYWDGGILSNTPTEVIFDDNPRKNSLIFAVHLWNPMGDEPATIWEFSTVIRTSSTPAGLQATLPGSAKCTRCGTSFATSQTAAGRRSPDAGGTAAVRIWLSHDDARRPVAGPAT